jgi:RNA polymerase sigma-70 factor (ECF subfamily)
VVRSIGFTGQCRPDAAPRRRSRKVLRLRNRSLAGLHSAASALTDERSDEELLRVFVSNGDRSAFAALYRRYQDVVYRFAFQMSGREATAEDITQETFLRFAAAARRYDARRASVSTYLYGIVRNLTRRSVRLDRVLVTLTGTNHAQWKAHEPLVEQSLVDEAAKRETIERVRRAILSLPPRYREVVVLCDLHRRSYADAAAIIGCAEGTVASRLSRARDLLLAKLRPLRRTEDV